MAYRIRIVSQPINWSGRKIRMMVNDIRQMLSREGAPNCLVEIEPADGTGKHAPPQKLYLHLMCEPCLEEWFSETFSECPKCKGKDQVTKV